MKGTAIIADDLLVFGEGDDIESATKDHDEILKKCVAKSSQKKPQTEQSESQVKDEWSPLNWTNLDIRRNQTWSPKKVEAVYRMPQCQQTYPQWRES